MRRPSRTFGGDRQEKRRVECYGGQGKKDKKYPLWYNEKEWSQDS